MLFADIDEILDMTPEEKLTPDNEIIEALGCCSSPYQKCFNCPLCEMERVKCFEELSANALDIINRQKAEIDRLKQDLKSTTKNYVEGGKIIKTEAVKELAEVAIRCEKIASVTMTNADRIRAMSDEELADFFFESPEIEFEVCEYCQYFGGHASDTPCKHDIGSCLVSAKNEAFKKWLQQPAE